LRESQVMAEPHQWHPVGCNHAGGVMNLAYCAVTVAFDDAMHASDADKLRISSVDPALDRAHSRLHIDWADSDPKNIHLF
jgi:hypothetical protein